jgi:hypothetical protein
MQPTVTDQNQLFHPFSQENPLQTGTGLGLTIVNSIVQSESVGGKIDVWSKEGVGTEIKVVFLARKLDEVQDPSLERRRLTFDNPPTVSLVGFDESHPGERLLRAVFANYLVSWWGFKIQPASSEYGELVILNNDPSAVVVATEKRDTRRPFILLSSSRGNPRIMTIVSKYQQIGGFCRIVHKPGGPSRLGSVLKLCLHACNIGSRLPSSETEQSHVHKHNEYGPISRRHSEEHGRVPTPTRPGMGPRPTTINAIATSPKASSPTSPTPPSATPTTIGPGGTLLESSVGTLNTSNRPFRVLVMEDNGILRNLLCVFLLSFNGCHLTLFFPMMSV